MGVAEFGEADLFFLERGKLRRRVRQLTEAPTHIAFDAVVCNALAHQVHRIDPGTLQIAHAFLTHILGETFDLVANPADQLTAIAAAGAPANPPRLDQHHRQPALSQLDGGVDPSEPAADHADINAQITVQDRVGSGRPSRGCVVGAGVFLGVLIHLFDFTLLQERVIRRMIAWGGVEEM